MEGLQADSVQLHQGFELLDFQSVNWQDPLTSLAFSDRMPFLQMLAMEPFSSPFPPPKTCLLRPWPAAVELESCITETHSPVKSEAAAAAAAGKGKKKRKRLRPGKNKEETESQRMTHIAVERNRRKTMNNHLAALRSLMPSSFVQRGDQASIVGGAIDFVKELEQLLQSLEAEKRRRDSDGNGIPPPFNAFFTSPQYRAYSGGECTAAPAADVEVAVVQSHVSVKVLAPRRPGRLVKAIAGLEELSLTILHLNITSLDHSVLYSFNLKIEEECKFVSADEIATAVYQIFSYINTE